MRLINRFEDNVKLSDIITYIASVIVRGYKVNIYLDDYGQSYFITYIDSDGEIKEMGLGTYNVDYIETIAYEFDPKGFTISEFGIDYWKERMFVRKQRGLESIDYEDYDNTYNFSDIYKQIKNI